MTKITVKYHYIKIYKKLRLKQNYNTVKKIVKNLAFL